VLDRALAVTGSERTGSGEQSGDGAGLHRVPSIECGPGLNARARKCGRAAHADAASRAV
jgi:hypothetical protein